MKQILIILIMSFLVSACTANQNKVVAVKVGDEYYAADASASAALSKEDNNEKIICRKVTKTGSRMSTRVCSTKQEIEENRAEDRRRISENIQHNQTQRTAAKRGG